MSYKFAIIGKGFIFSRHKEAVESTGGAIILTCDNDPGKKTDFLDYKEMLKSPRMDDIDAIIIATPNHLHKQMIKDCLAAGKKVLCEKPLILDDDFTGLEDAKVVLQLRYHDFTEKIKKELKEYPELNEVEINMTVCRDKKWWDSWRGDEEKSGGIVMGLAVHMFDFVINLLGDVSEFIVVEKDYSKDTCFGIVMVGNTLIRYEVRVIEDIPEYKKYQTREFIINGKKFEMCNKDNLSFAGYHDKVHEEFAKGNGIPAVEAEKAIRLINTLK